MVLGSLWGGVLGGPLPRHQDWGMGSALEVRLQGHKCPLVVPN